MQLWLILNSIGILILAALQYLVIRQIGLMLVRLGPIGARSSVDDGPRAGEVLSQQFSELRAGLPVGTRDLLVLFGSRSCSLCSEIRAGAQALQRHWSGTVQIVMVYDEVFDLSDCSLPIFFDWADKRRELSIKAVPFGVRVDSSDRVLGKGLVNTISHVESLLELQSHEMEPQIWSSEQKLEMSAT